MVTAHVTWRRRRRRQRVVEMAVTARHAHSSWRVVVVVAGVELMPRYVSDTALLVINSVLYMYTCIAL